MNETESGNGPWKTFQLKLIIFLLGYINRVFDHFRLIRMAIIHGVAVMGGDCRSNSRKFESQPQPLPMVVDVAQLVE